MEGRFISSSGHDMDKKEKFRTFSFSPLPFSFAKSRGGFTIIELLVVIGIIGVLAGVLLASFSGGTESARAAKCLSNMRNLAQGAISYAADKQWCLVVECAGGETIAIGADLKPVIATTADGYELRYGEQVTAFTWSELKKVTVQETVADESATPVKDVKVAPQAKTAFSVAPGEIRIDGAEPGSVAIVYTLNGRQALSTRVGDSGTVTLDITGLPAGMYIIKTNKSTFKLVKK